MARTKSVVVGSMERGGSAREDQGLKPCCICNRDLSGETYVQFSRLVGEPDFEYGRYLMCLPCHIKRQRLRKEELWAGDGNLPHSA